jgi:hypothetical protein
MRLPIAAFPSSSSSSFSNLDIEAQLTCIVCVRDALFVLLQSKVRKKKNKIRKAAATTTVRAV